MKRDYKDYSMMFVVHKWVNAESMMEKCFIGPLVGVPKMGPPRTGSRGSLRSNASIRSANSLLAPITTASGSVLLKPHQDSSIRYDWYQNDRIVTIAVYTRAKDIQMDSIILELKDQKDLNAIFILGEKSYQLHLDLEEKVSNQQVRIANDTGKVDLLLTKDEPGKTWSGAGKPLDGNDTLKAHKSRESQFWECTLTSVEEVSHNTQLLGFELPPGVLMRVPVGHHVHVKRNIQGMEITRSYTVVLPSLNIDRTEREYEGRRFYLMIKIYPDGALTPTLQQLAVGDKVLISDYSGDFQVSRLSVAKDVCLIAGGTGFTPMVRIIRKLIVEDPKATVSVKLLFANQEEKDILWRKQLDDLVEASNQRFQVLYTISKPTAEWEGYEGRISNEMLLDALPPPPAEKNASDLLIGICGPEAFTHSMISLLKGLNYTSNMMHAFLG
ncbi:cytochrome b5 reductase 4-like isoform X2 [Nematostella vectensis]|uniref:cytochrome b5 reductase 4-like isoform X2 n=2 Tax=Nematostella vectensis TaxID=45351 RepID=UPI002076E6A1|nr:cytochrome b5 reductase 4-like isoform X2 [Nematostella vectensis]